MLQNLATSSTNLTSSPLLLFLIFLLIGLDPFSFQPLIVHIVIYMYLCTSALSPLTPGLALWLKLPFTHDDQTPASWSSWYVRLVRWRVWRNHQLRHRLWHRLWRPKPLNGSAQMQCVAFETPEASHPQQGLYQIKVAGRAMQYIINEFNTQARHTKSASSASPSTSR